MPLLLQEARRRFCYCLLLLAIAVVLHRPTYAQKLNRMAHIHHRTLLAGNRMYEVVIEDTVGTGVGLYTVRTGPEHPITQQFDSQKQDLLDVTGTSFLTVRSYNSKKDYTQSDIAVSEPGFTSIWLDNTFGNSKTSVVTPILNRSAETTGFRVKYKLPGATTAPDKMAITQVINVNGAGFNDSWVELTTMVKNTGTDTLKIGIRYMLHLKVGGDTGPVLIRNGFGVGLGNHETRLDSINFAFLRAEANDAIGLTPPGYNVFASAITPANLLRTPHQSTRLQHVFWPFALLSAFNYNISSQADLIITKDEGDAVLTGGDSAIQYFWGETRDRALKIPPNDSVQVTQALFAALPNRPPSVVLDQNPPKCNITIIDPGPPKRVRLRVNDPASGLQALQVLKSSNLQFTIPQFDIGTINTVQIDFKAINAGQPAGFCVEATDLCGNKVVCDPIFIALQPSLHVFEYRLEPVFADRYFYLSNQGIKQIKVDLNGHKFILSSAATDQLQDKNNFGMPAHGEMVIDIIRYLKEDANTMTIAFDGPEGSRADLVLSDLTIKGDVDLILDLTPVPQQFALAQNLPNPFHSATTIHFEVPALESNVPRVELKIYNMLGQLVRTLVDADLPSGSYRQEWDGRDDVGREVAAGVYFYNLNANGIRMNKKMALIR
jgi:hypothetical protein